MIIISEINDGSLINNHAIHFLFPVIFATNIKQIAGIAKIADNIANFSI